ncbi:MAG: ATP-binding protein [Porticoccaceae bacterium]|nr:ATP-binding protein [Porticoccaceae bacterium]
MTPLSPEPDLNKPATSQRMARRPAAFITGIRSRLFLLSIIPVVIVNAIITWHTIDTRRSELANNLLLTTTLTAENLARVSDFAIFTGQADLLRSFTDATKHTPFMQSVVFLDRNRELLFATQPQPLERLMDLKAGNYSHLEADFLVIERPVYLNDIDISDYQTTQEPQLEQEEATDSLLGWVVVSADRSGTNTLAREILLTHLLISLVVLAGAAVLTYLLSNTVVRPITAITRTVRELEEGNLHARLAPSGHDELAMLAHGINHLASTILENRQNLQNKVSAATQQLQTLLDDLQQKNHELDKARREAEDANQAKTGFLAQMSHELRTPITAIQGFVRLLGESQLTAAEKRYCIIIQQASLQLLQLIDDIIDITRLHSGSIELESAPFNLLDCLEGPVALMAPSAHQKGLELILDLAPNLPQALIGDNLRIRQIVYNLVSNAIKFTSSGEVIVRVSARGSTTVGKQARLLIQVIDTGIGIPEKQRALIFEPFSQADNSISRRFGGSGLGLTIVRNLVTLMDGTIHIDSTAGKGTTFAVELPLTVSALAEPPQPDYSCVLLFDSHPHSRHALERLLTYFVESIESCESTTDLEIGGGGQEPDIILYSVPVSQAPSTLEHHVDYLRNRFACPIVIIAPLSNFSPILHDWTGGDGKPVRFIDKPPTMRELTALLTAEKNDDNAQGSGTQLSASILIAEDNEFNRLLLATFLEHLGSNITTVTNGQQAIAICDHQAFDLILMDVHMPEMNGINAIKAIRSGQGLNCHTPIVMLTADILQQEENALFEAGANDLLFKPIDEGKLISTLQRHLRLSVASDERKPLSPNADMTLFIQEVSKLTDSILQAVDDHEPHTLRESLHQLLGIAGVFKMTYLERAVKALHFAVKDQHEERIQAALVTLAVEVEQLRKELHLKLD